MALPQVPIWCPCSVIRIADGATDKGRDGQLLSVNARKLAPAGMMLVEWEPDPDRGEHKATQCWETRQMTRSRLVTPWDPLRTLGTPWDPLGPPLGPP